MSKTFAKKAPKPPQAKQPTPDEITAFERAGAGHDQNPQTHKPANVVKVSKAEPMKRLSIDIPASKHTAFKTACSANNLRMAREIENFIDKRLKELAS